MKYLEMPPEILKLYFDNYNDILNKVQQELSQKTKTYQEFAIKRGIHKEILAGIQDRINVNKILASESQKMLQVAQKKQNADPSVVSDLREKFERHRHDLEHNLQELAKQQKTVQVFNKSAPDAFEPIQHLTEAEQFYQKQLAEIRAAARTRNIHLGPPPRPERKSEIKDDLGTSPGKRAMPVPRAPVRLTARPQTALPQASETEKRIARDYATQVQSSFEALLEQINQEAQAPRASSSSSSSASSARSTPASRLQFAAFLDQTLARGHNSAQKDRLERMSLSSKAKRLDALSQKQQLKQAEAFEQRMLRIMLLRELSREKMISNSEINVIKMVATEEQSPNLQKTKNMIRYECRQAFAKLLLEELDKQRLTEQQKQTPSYQQLKHLVSGYQTQAKMEYLHVNQAGLATVADIVRFRQALIADVQDMLLRTHAEEINQAGPSYRASSEKAIQEIAEKIVNRKLSATLKKFQQTEAPLDLKLQRARAVVLDEAFQASVKSDADKQWRQQHAFYQKWKSKIKVVQAQGYGEGQEIIGQGVCYAKSINIMSAAIRNPDAPIEAVIMDNISGKVRFQQARYAAHHRLASNQTFIPRDAAMANLTPDSVQYHVGQGDRSLPKKQQNSANQARLAKTIDALLGKLEAGQSPHVAMLDLKFISGGAHAADVRCDKARGKFWFHEPNFGTFEADSREELTHCILDSLTHLYGNDIAYAGFSLPDIKPEFRQAPAKPARQLKA